MDNSQIADNLSLLSKLMDIHGENPFKSKSFANAAFAIDKLPVQLSAIPKEKISAIKGVGESSAKKIIELLETGYLESLQDITAKTPEGILEMMSIKGLGPKKIATIWKEMEIENIGELLYACKENRLKLFKGFGEKTQQNIIDTIEYYLKNKGKFLFAQLAPVADWMSEFLATIFNPEKIALTGKCRRQLEIIEEIEFVIDFPISEIEKKISAYNNTLSLLRKEPDSIIYKTSEGILLRLFGTDNSPFLHVSFKQTCSDIFYEHFRKMPTQVNFYDCQNEEDIFKLSGINYIEPFRRESPTTLELALTQALPSPIRLNDIKGVIHSHSTWSDGAYSIEEMALYARKNNFEYLVISDHSKSAFYAQGLSEERIFEQHRHIEELNKKITGFKIFKSIESDILNDGSLDYPPEILSTFDLVIASVHSNLKMTEEKAMDRLLKAIENPYTTILGHMTGRLLLSRKGYPLDHDKIIDACVANNVVIELNANPNRLDIDWRFIDKALEKGAFLSINPDAHSLDGISDITYGVSVAQKTLLTKERNLSSFSCEAFEEYLITNKKR